MLAERYVAVGETDFTGLIGAILAARPDFVFSTLIGSSAYAFLGAFRAACAAAGFDQAAEMPVASCSLSEPELAAIDPTAVDGHLSASVYFSTIATAQNGRFLAAYDARFPAGPAASADAEASYVATLLLARRGGGGRIGRRDRGAPRGGGAAPASAARRGLDRRGDVACVPHAADRTVEQAGAVRHPDGGAGAGAARSLSGAQLAAARSAAVRRCGWCRDAPRLVQNFRDTRATVVADAGRATRRRLR